MTKVSKSHDFEDTPFQVTLRTAWAMLFAALWVSTEFAFIEILVVILC